MRSNRLVAVLVAAAATTGAAAVTTQPAAAKGTCTWTVDGQIKVTDTRITGLKASAIALEGIEVKVSGREKILGAFASYASWGTTYTDSQGRYHLVNTKNQCGDRNIKVAVHFEDSDLSVKGNGSKTWYDLVKNSKMHKVGAVDFGLNQFGATGANDGSDAEGRVNAETWVVYRKALDYLSVIGHPIGLTKLTVHNPFNTVFTGETSYTDPLTDDIHIHIDDQFEMMTMLHELGHAITYPLVSGEDCLLTDLGSSLDTHQFRESTCVAFHEGLAEAIARGLAREMTEAGKIDLSGYYTTDVLTRAHMFKQLGLKDLDDVQHNDGGWTQLLVALQELDLNDKVLGSSADVDLATPDDDHAPTRPCLSRAPRLSLADLLTVVSGMDTGSPLAELDPFGLFGDSVTFTSFLNRAVTKVPALIGSGDVDKFRTVADPAATDEPCDLWPLGSVIVGPRL